MGGEHNLKSNNWNINLNKTVYNNKEFDDVVDRDFSQLIKTKKPINVERLFTFQEPSSCCSVTGIMSASFS